MMRRLTLVSALAVLSAVAFTTQAQAQTADVDFSGTVAPTCFVNSTTNGTLTLVNNRTLLADSANGTPGNLNVSCNSGTTLTVNSVTDIGTVLAGGVTYDSEVDGAFATVRDGATVVAQGDVSPTGNAATFVDPGTAGPLQAGPFTDKEYSVDLSVFKVGDASVLPAGDYNVRVNISLAPQ